MEQTVIEGFRLLDQAEVAIMGLSFVLFWALWLSGRATFGVAAPRAVLPILGLTIIYVLFIIGSTISPGLSLTMPLLLLAVLAAIGLWRSRYIALQDAVYLVAALLFVSPLILLALVVNEPMWDDFTHWLVSAQYLFREGHLPTRDNMILNSSHPSYPYARALLHAWVNGVSGEFTINVQGLFNIFFASTLLLWVPVWIHVIISRGPTLLQALAGMACFSWVIVFWALLLSNTLIISSYADPIYVVLMVHIFFVLSLDFIQKGRFSRSDKKLDPVLVCLFSAPLIIKQSGLYFSLMMFGLFWLLTMAHQIKSDRFINLPLLLRKSAFQALYVLPMLGFHFLWNFYVTTQSIKPSFGLRAQEFWNFDVLPQILKGIGIQMMARPYTAVAALIICVMVISSLRRSDRHLNKLFFLLPLSLGFFGFALLFQILAYCVAFVEFEAVRGASFNRYIAPSGLVMWSVLLVYSIQRFVNLPAAKQRGIAIAFFMSFFALIISESNKIVPPQRFNPHLIDAAETIKSTYPKGEKLLILDLLGNGIEATIIRFYLNSHMEAEYVNAFRTNKIITHTMLQEWTEGWDHLYIHTAPDYVLLLLGVEKKLVELGQTLQARYPAGENLLILDLLGNGKNSSVLVFMLKKHMNVTLKRQSDLTPQAVATQILSWLEGQQHVYIYSAPESVIKLVQQAASVGKP